METSPAQFFSEPILTSPGQPLRVAVYSRISLAIRNGTLPAGAILPRETELAQSMGVSRTVVREALMLLEEDGHIVTRRGIGRFVADTIPHSGVERFQSVEALLAKPSARIVTTVLEHTRQETTDFVSGYLPITENGWFWFRESLIANDSHPLALVQEYTPDTPHMEAVSSALPDLVKSVPDDGVTILSVLIRTLASSVVSGSCAITVSIAGPTRAAHLGIKAADPVLILTQTALVAGTPVLVSKAAFTPESGHLSVSQSGLTRANSG